MCCYCSIAPAVQSLLRQHVDQAPPRFMYLLSLTRQKHWHGFEYKYDKQLVRVFEPCAF